MKFIEESAVFLALFLISGFSLALLDKYFWLFTLLGHFRIQYFIGALILMMPLIYLQNYALAIILLAIAITSYIHIRLPFSDPWDFSTQPTTVENSAIPLKVAVYNKLFRNTNYVQSKKTLKDVDVIVFVEVKKAQLKTLTDYFSDTHPYSYDENLNHPSDMTVLSKYPIKNLTFKSVTPLWSTHGMRFEIQLAHMNNPVTFYAVHTKVPIGYVDQKIHNQELMSMAEWIKGDDAKHVLFMGDWNTTPYVPIFKDVLKTSGLKYKNFGVFPQTTWPSFFFLPFLKIPIDHILYSNTLELVDIHKDKSNGSDHHALIASFRIPQEKD